MGVVGVVGGCGSAAMAAGDCGDAFLDIDNVSGFGPENINIESPIDGVYDVAVNYYGGRGGTSNLFVKVFINGALRLDLSNRVVNSKDVWNVARIDWSAGDAVITTVDSVSQLPCN